MVEFISNLYNSILQIIDFVIGRTSDTLADIMIRALPLLAPLPNAISVYYVVQHAPLNYNTAQAFGAAAALECMFFALTEVALKMWDGVQYDRRYIYALRVMVALFIGYFLLVILMVALLEVQHGNYAPLAFPFVSVVAALTLGCERWHKRNLGTAQRKRTNVQPKAEIVQPEIAQKDESDGQNVQIVDAQNDKEKRRERAIQLHSEGLNNVQIANELEVHRNTVRGWLKNTNGHSAKAVQS